MRAAVGQLFRVAGEPGLIGSSLRASLGLTLAVAVGQGLGHPEWGFFAALGVLLVALADTGGPYAERAIAMLISLAGVCGLLAVGTVLSSTYWAGVAALAVVAFVVGVMRSYGAVGLRVGGVIGLAYLFGFGIAAPAADAGPRALACLVGGVAAIILVCLVWPLRPDRVARACVVEGLLAIGDYTEALGRANETIGTRDCVRRALERLRAELDSLGVWKRQGEALCRILVRLYWETAQLFAATAVAERAIAAIPVDGVQAREALRLLAERERATADNGVLAADSAADGDKPLDQAIAAADRCCAAISRDLAALDAATPGRGLPFSRPPISLAALMATARRELRPGEAGLHHALRLTIAATSAAIIASSFGLERSYWAPLTVIVILTPDARQTLARTGQRVIGTLSAAVGMAVLLAAIPGSPALDVLVFVSAFVFFVFFGRNYLVAAGAITALILTLIELVEPSGWQLAGYRIADTLVGVAVTVIVSLVLWRDPEERPMERTLRAIPAAAAAMLEALADVARGAHLTLAVVGERRRALGVALLHGDELVIRLTRDRRRKEVSKMVGAGREISDAVNALLILRRESNADEQLAVFADSEALLLTNATVPRGGGETLSVEASHTGCDDLRLFVQHEAAAVQRASELLRAALLRLDERGGEARYSPS